MAGDQADGLDDQVVALGHRLQTLLGWRQHPDPGELQRWLADGYEPERDIVPAVRSVLNRQGFDPQSVRSIKYFRQAVHDGERLAEDTGQASDDPWYDEFHQALGVSRSEYISWFSGCRFERRNGCVVILAPTKWQKERVANHYFSVLKAAFGRNLYIDVQPATAAT